MISLPQLSEHDWQDWRALRLAALTDAPAAFSSTLVDWTGTGDTEERWRSRLISVPFNLIAELDGRLLGMASGTSLTDDKVERISMWVAPEGRGRGLGDALIEAVVEWPRQQGALRVGLDVREDNSQAIALYERNGFVDCGVAPAPGERRMVRHLRRAGHPLLTDIGHRYTLTR